jgi:hypothetical protein
MIPENPICFLVKSAIFGSVILGSALLDSARSVPYRSPIARRTLDTFLPYPYAHPRA